MVKKIFVIIFLSMGMYFLLDGMLCQYYINKTVDLKNVDVNELQERLYVQGTVEYFVGGPSKMEGDENIYPICTVNAWTGDCYYLACVNEKKNQFVCIEVGETFIKDFEQSLDKNLKSQYNLECKAVKETEFNRDTLGTYYENFQDKIIYNQDYILKIVDYKMEEGKLSRGVALFIAAMTVLALYVNAYHEERYVSENDVDDARKDTVVIEGEISKIIAEALKKKIAMENKWRVKKKKICIDVFFLLIMALVYLVCDFERILYVICLLSGMLLFHISIFAMFSQNKIVVCLAQKRGYDTLKKQMMLNEKILDIYNGKKQFI